LTLLLIESLADLKNAHRKWKEETLKTSEVVRGKKLHFPPFFLKDMQKS